MTPPPVPGPFSWTSSPCGLVLRCRPLDEVAPRLFTTRALPLSSSQDWQRVAEALGAERVATLDQVHGREVVTITRHTVPSPDRLKADALASDNPTAAVAIRAADCVPLLLGDSRTGTVAAVHAGDPFGVRTIGCPHGSFGAGGPRKLSIRPKPAVFLVTPGGGLT